MQQSNAGLLADATASLELKAVNPAEQSDGQPCKQSQSNQHDVADPNDAQATNKEFSEEAISAHESGNADMMLCDRLERASLCVVNLLPASTAIIMDLPYQDIIHYVPVVRSASVSSLTESARSGMLPQVVSPSSTRHVVDAGNASASASSISASISAIASSSRIGSSGISETFSAIDRDVSSLAASESDELSSISSCSSTAAHTSTRPIENIPCATIQLEMHHLAMYDAFCPHILKENSKQRRNNNRRKPATQLAHDSDPLEQGPGDTIFPDSVLTCPAVVSISDSFRDHVPAPLQRMEDQYIGFDQLRGILLRFVHRRHLFLDLGCGASDICKQLVLHGYNHVYGIDVDQSKVAFQRQQTLELGAFVRIQRMNAADMTFPDQFFDCVFTKAVLDEIACGKRFQTPQATQTKLLRVLSEILRCVKPGGMWILVTCQTPQPASAAQKSERPWWQWETVEEAIQHYASLEVEYHAGAPHAFGEPPPFAIRLYRRSETVTQRLRRLWLERDQELKSQAEIKAFDRWQQEKRHERAENASREHEARQMVQEDMESALWASIHNYQDAKNTRNMIRKTILERIHQEERAIMVQEDSLSTVMQAYVFNMLQQVDCIILDLANYAVESSSQRAAEKERRQEIIAKARAHVAASSELPSNHLDWIREWLMNTIDAIVRDIADAQPVSECPVTSKRSCEVVALECPETTAMIDPDLVAEEGSKTSNESSGVKHANSEICQVQYDDQPTSGSERLALPVKRHEPASNVVSFPDCDQMSVIQTCIDMVIERAIASSEPQAILNIDNSAGIDPAHDDTDKPTKGAVEHTKCEIAVSVESDHQSAGVHSQPMSALSFGTETDVICQQVIKHLVTSIEDQKDALTHNESNPPDNTTIMNPPQ